MFRPLQFPLFKGTGDPLRPTPQPIPVRVHGLEGTGALGEQLAGLHQGAIRSFIRGQRQQYALGPMPRYGVRREVRPGVTVGYRNHNGDEIVDVWFSPQLVDALRPTGSHRDVFDMLLMGSIDVGVGSSELSNGAYGPAGPSPETAFDGFVEIGAETFSATATASFGRGVRMVVYVFSTWEELNYFEPNEPTGTEVGMIVPDNGGPIWAAPAAASVVNSIFPRTPTSETIEQEYYDGPWREYTNVDPNPETVHNKFKFVRKLASELSIDLQGQLTVTARGKAYGQWKDTSFGAEPQDDWTIITTCSASFYPRNLGFYERLVRSWRGWSNWSNHSVQRWAAIRAVTYAGSKRAIKRAGTPFTASYTIDMSAGLTKAYMRQESLPGVLFVDLA